MSRLILLALWIASALAVAGPVYCQEKGSTMEGHIRLPPPSREGRISLEAAIMRRRSVRRFRPQAISIGQASQLLWSAQGITDSLRGLRAAPSAGACYPMDVYLAAGQVSGLEPGNYRYHPLTHSLEMISRGDPREILGWMGRTQPMVTRAPAIIVIVADPNRIKPRYGVRAERYTFMEAGHIGQNVALQAVVLGLATVMVGAFSDGGVRKALGLPPRQIPLYLIPVGYQDDQTMPGDR